MKIQKKKHIPSPLAVDNHRHFNEIDNRFILKSFKQFGSSKFKSYINHYILFGIILIKILTNTNFAQLNNQSKKNKVKLIKIIIQTKQIKFL